MDFGFEHVVIDEFPDGVSAVKYALELITVHDPFGNLTVLATVPKTVLWGMRVTTVYRTLAQVMSTIAPITDFPEKAPSHVERIQSHSHKGIDEHVLKALAWKPSDRIFMMNLNLFRGTAQYASSQPEAS